MSSGTTGSCPPSGASLRTCGRSLTAVLLSGCIWLTACQHGNSGSPAPTAASEATAATAGAAGSAQTAEAKEADSGVSLSPEETAKLGLLTETAKTTDYLDETPGYGVVVSHEVIAQAVAELATARATERMSRSALARAQKLSGTPGAVSADVEETAAQKAQVDAAALTLTAQKLSSVLGAHPPWKPDGSSPILGDLASGKVKLVRATVPFDAVGSGTPSRLRAAHMGTSNPAARWTLTTIWDAPADATVPGRSFFALLKGSDASEGERLQVWASTGKTEPGVLVPAAAAVLSDSKFWCYVEKAPGRFSRVELDTSRSSAEGYFVTEGIAAGDKIVTAAAGQLLAKETGSSAEPD